MLSFRTRNNIDDSSASGQSPQSEHESKRRKVRKGTHSCWECRRRKIKCQYASPDDEVCVGCQARGSKCRSQEFVDETPSAPSPTPDRRLTQRLGKLEEMMERLVDKIMPEDTPSATSPPEEPAEPVVLPRCPSTAAGHAGPAVDVLDTSAANDTPVAAFLGLQDVLSSTSPSAGPTPASDGSCGRGTCSAPTYLALSKKLHALFPSQQDIDAITRAGDGSAYVVSFFYSQHDIDNGRAESTSSIANVPSSTSHPALLGKRLLQLAICMQQLSPAFHLQHKLQLKEPLGEVISKIAGTVAHTVTSDDEVIGSVEGLQCLILLGFQQANAGNLRKSWLTYRRALGLAQLMGLDRGSSRALKSCDPTSDPTKRPNPEFLWYRINACDRHQSLLLGLPVATRDDFVVSDDAAAQETPLERLQRQHVVVAARLIERNSGKSGQAYALTQAIDYDLETTAGSLSRTWWAEPDMDVFVRPEDSTERITQLITQIHHFCLVILLHLPYMLRDPTENRYDYSKISCMKASREVLRRFIAFRTLISSAYSCRHVDYGALIAAMTLLLSYLGPRPWVHLDEAFEMQRKDDKSLVEHVRGRMEHVAVLNQDRLSRESADIIKQLLPIIDLVVGDSAAAKAQYKCNKDHQACLQLSIPFLGTVNIRPGSGNVARPVNGGAQPAGTVVSSDNPTNSDTSLELEDSEAVAQSRQALWSPGSPTGAVMGGQNHEFVGGSSSTTYNSILPPMELYADDSEMTGFTFPDLTAESDDWAFQGVDTAFWSLINGGGSVSGV